jgi:S-adenosyl-L-methionine hydrolase (adenosine-forming)
MAERTIVTLTTDFGYRDPFVGTLKGVLLSLNPDLRLVDISHGIPPQDVAAGALTLRAAVPFFPAGTIHVGIVDPGVGSARRPLLIEAGKYYFVGPDNGLFSLALEEMEPQRIIELTNDFYHQYDLPRQGYFCSRGRPAVPRHLGAKTRHGHGSIHKASLARCHSKTKDPAWRSCLHRRLR